MLTGGGAADKLFGLAGADTLDGGEGNDALTGGLGADTIDGGNGIDLVSFRALPATGVSVTLDGSTAVVVSGALDTIVNVENVFGTELADTITGDGADNVIRGFGGTDTLEGKGGSNILSGGDDNDVLVSSTGNDKLFGDGGDDELDLNARTTLVGCIFDGGSGTDTVDLAPGNVILDSTTRFRNVESLDVFNTVIVGTSSNNRLNFDGISTIALGSAFGIEVNGGQGNDIISGSTAVDANDTLSGEDGNDRLFGNGGNDELNGGADDDVLRGGAGSDTLNGGTGLDRFVFDFGPGAGNSDTIEDFTVVDDTIQLAKSVFTAFAAVNRLTADAFTTGIAASDAEDRIVFDQATGSLFYDEDGTGAIGAVQFATISVLTGTLTAADFSLL